MTCTRCNCPQCVAEREQFTLLWAHVMDLFELAVYEASHARGYNTKVEPMRKEFMVYMHRKQKSQPT